MKLRLGGLSRRFRLGGLSRRGITWNKVFGDASPPSSFSGKRVNERTALKYSVVYRSVALIADAVASLPPRAFIEDAAGRDTPADLPTWIRKPHPEIQRFTIWHQLLVSVLLWGNAYALLSHRESDGQINGLRVLDPARVQCEWDPSKPSYRRYKVDDGPWLTAADVFHIQGMTLPGAAKGLSVIGQAREAVALGLTLEEFGARYFSQGSMAKVILKLPQRDLKPEQATDIVRTYERFHRGANNWHRPAIFFGYGQNGGIENISIPPEDAQFLQTREFQALDVARWFGVPPHRVGIVSKQSSWGSGLAEENTAMVQHTFRRYILMLETTLTAYAPGGEDRGVRIRLDDSALLRGTIKDQVETWTKAVTSQIVTPDEARGQIGLPPIEGGDKLVQYTDNPGPNRTDQEDPQSEDDETASRSLGKDAARLSRAELRWSQVDRTIVKPAGSCSECEANDDPARVPVHPNCDCEVETKNVETGVTLIDQVYGVLTGEPELTTVANLEFGEFRFGDLLAWAAGLPPLSEDSWITVVDADVLGEGVWLLAQRIAEAARADADDDLLVHVVPAAASTDELARLYRAVLEKERA